MYSYLIGTVVEMNIDHIVVENSGIGYLIYVNNPYEYTRGKEIKIFLYQQVKEDALLLYGFKTSEEKEMFLKLILHCFRVRYDIQKGSNRFYNFLL